MTQPQKEQPIADTATATEQKPVNDNAAVVAKPDLDTVSKIEPLKVETPVQETVKKSLRGSFNKAAGILTNVAIGAGAAAAAKTGATLWLASLAVPPLGILLVSSLAVGAAGVLTSHIIENRALKKQNQPARAFWAKEKTGQHARNFLKSTVFAAIGGAIYMGFSEGLFQNAWNSVFGTAPAPVVEALPAPVVVSPVEKLTETLAAAPQAAAADVKVALARTASENVVVSAQATKDLAYYTLNGFQGVPKNPELAVELFKTAAEAGSVQAKVDLAYLQYHGLAGIPADKTAAMAAMQELNTAKAKAFVKAWGGVAKAVVAAPVPTV